MPFDYTKAELHRDILRNPDLMTAMHAFNSASTSLIADSPTKRREPFEAYAAAHGVNDALEAVVNDLSNVERIYDHVEERDGFARANMMRLAMKELILAAAFASKVVSPRELSGIEVPAGVMNQTTVDALKDMGFPTLACIAEHKMK